MKHVFPSSTSQSGHIQEPKKWFELIEQETGIKVSPHDMRRTFASAGEIAGITPRALSQLLNHSTTADITSRYVIMNAEQLREPMQKICDQLKKWCDIIA